jgi:hypothetical protein
VEVLVANDQEDEMGQRKALMRVACRGVALLVALLTFNTARADDTYTVHIVFTGLMTFKLASGAATIIIPNVSPGRAKEGDQPHQIEKHVAYILASQGDFGAHPNPAEFGYPDPGHGVNKYKYVALDGEWVMVDEANAVADHNSFLVYSTEADGVECPDANTLHSMHWLSSLAGVTGTTHMPDPDHFDSNPDAGVVAARIAARYGTLETHVVKNSEVSAFQLDVANSPVVARQAIAQEVYWNFKAVGSTFALVLRKFDRSGSRSVEFKSPGAGGDLFIIIGNTMQSDVGALIESPPQVDEHYSVYYEFIKGNAQGLGPIPFPTGAQCPDAYLDKKTLSLTPQEQANENHTAAAGGLNCGPDNWP